MNEGNEVRDYVAMWHPLPSIKESPTEHPTHYIASTCRFTKDPTALL
ncbi:hypothetical protein ACOMHN_060239 [Nucella lapillus]